MTKDALDFSVILEKCGTGREPIQVVIKNIVSHTQILQYDEIAHFFAYLLDNIKDADLLFEIVKITDSNRHKIIHSKLLDILLMKNIDDSDIDKLVNLRVLCAKAIANYKDASSVNTLLYCLNNKDENYKIRLACADALGRIGDKFAVEPLLNVVRDEDEKSVYVKESATFALGLIGDTSAIDPLVTIMEAKQGLFGKFSFLKEKIVEALGKLNLNNAKVLKVLKTALLDSSSMVRINAIEALMNSEYEEAWDLIHLALKDEDIEVKRNALIALYNMSGRDFLDKIISLPSYDDFLKNEAKILLEEYEDD